MTVKSTARPGVYRAFRQQYADNHDETEHHEPKPIDIPMPINSRKLSESSIDPNLQQMFDNSAGNNQRRMSMGSIGSLNSGNMMNMNDNKKDDKKKEVESSWECMLLMS